MAEESKRHDSVKEWDRKTVADGLALNRDTIKPLIDRTKYLYDQIKDFSEFEIVTELPSVSEAKSNQLYIKVNENNPDKAKIYVLNKAKTAFIEIGSDHRVEDEVLYID